MPWPSSDGLDPGARAQESCYSRFHCLAAWRFSLTPLGSDCAHIYGVAGVIRHEEITSVKQSSCFFDMEASHSEKRQLGACRNSRGTFIYLRRCRLLSEIQMASINPFYSRILTSATLPVYWPKQPRRLYVCLGTLASWSAHWLYDSCVACGQIQDHTVRLRCPRAIPQYWRSQIHDRCRLCLYHAEYCLRLRIVSRNAFSSQPCLIPLR